jgi:cobalt/nickel transport protein
MPLNRVMPSQIISKLKCPMASNLNQAKRNRLFIISGLGIALLIAVLLSPFASQQPDGLDRVAQDQGFEQKAAESPIAKQLPFAAIFEEYSLRNVPEAVATPLAGLVGTLVTFGLAWGVGKVAVKNPPQKLEDER